LKKLTEEFNKITINKNDVLSIELPSSPSTGYVWKLSVKAGKIETLASSFNTAGNDNLIGQACTQSFRFKAGNRGNVEISAEYKRPWEKKAAAKKISFKIEVK